MSYKTLSTLKNLLSIPFLYLSAQLFNIAFKKMRAAKGNLIFSNIRDVAFAFIVTWQLAENSLNFITSFFNFKGLANFANNLNKFIETLSNDEEKKTLGKQPHNKNIPNKLQIATKAKEKNTHPLKNKMPKVNVKQDNLKLNKKLSKSSRSPKL